MVFNVGDRVRFVGPVAESPARLKQGAVGTVVGYWPDDGDVWFTTDLDNVDFEVPYPYYVKGLVAGSEDEPDDVQVVYAEHELEKVEG